jgi:hypothetical protein
LKFYGLGDDDQIPILATFPNGHALDVTDSTYLSRSSENPDITFVADDGTVVAVGAGQTHIIVSYTLGHRQEKILVPVVVETNAWSNNLNVSPAFFNFGDVPSNTVSSPLNISVTNRTVNDVHMFKVGPVAGFRIGPENCSDKENHCYLAAMQRQLLDLDE